MSLNVSNAFFTQYRENMELQLQQEKSQIWPVLREVPVAGEKSEVTEYIGNSATMTGDDRHGDTKYANTDHDRLWITKPPEEYWAELVDRQDQLASKIALGSAYMMAGASAIARTKDDFVLRAIYGNTITGKDGTVTNPLPAGMTVPVATGGSGTPQRFNTKKVRAATKLLANNFVNTAEKKYMVLTPEQNDDLLDEVPVTSADFKSFGGVVDDNGQVTRLLGWNFIHMMLANPLLKASPLTVDANGYRRTPFWTESGLVKGVWEELMTDISPLPQKRLSRQIFAATIVNATRTNPGKVGVILNSEQ